MFVLHEKLEKDCIFVGDLPLSALLLMNDANYPWFVLVPKRVGKREWYELDVTDQQQLLRETNAFAEYLQRHSGAGKMNIGALGNMVAQLHVHVIARFEQDIAWPAPVWGRAPAVQYGESALQERMDLGGEFIKMFHG